MLTTKDSQKKKLGGKWFKQFRKRNPSIVFKKPEKMDPKHMDISIPAIQNYFEQLRKLRLEYNISATRIFNADETGLPISPDLAKTIGIKGKSRPLRTTETYEQLTMMATICTNGETLSPLFIWRGKTVNIENG